VKAIHALNLATLAVDADPDLVGDQEFCERLAASVEKGTKALLCLRAGNYPKTHELARLFHELTRTGLAIPPELTELVDLTPFSSKQRYEIPIPRSHVDRHFLLEQVRNFHRWIETLA
jgi:HEPN domain-containing protein